MFSNDCNTFWKQRLIILVAIGSNLGWNSVTPLEVAHAAIESLRSKDIHVSAVSRFFEAPAWPDPTDPRFVNAVFRIETPLLPPELWNRLHVMENTCGRVRAAPNAPRTLDLDIIDYD